MRSFVLVAVLVLFSFYACSMGKRSPETRSIQARKAQDKLWRPCQDSEAQSPVGKVCSRHCRKRKGNSPYGKCLKWETKIKDFSKREDFLFFRNGSFIFIDEDNL